MPWATLPPGPGSPGESWMAHPEAFTDGPAHAEPLDGPAAPTKTQAHEAWGGRALEEDSGGALCEYIRAQARLEPSVKLRITGDNGAAFDFTIDLAPVLAQGGQNIRLFSRSHWAVYRDTAGRVRERAIKLRDDVGFTIREWRGWIFPEWDRGAGTRGRRHSNLHPPWSERCAGPWTKNEAQHEAEHEPLVRLGQLRRWCDAYVRDPGYLKSFTLKKEVWGWDLDLLRRTIQHRIWASGQRAYVDVEIDFDEVDVVVAPDNVLVRLRRNRAVMLLAWITLLYPFLWVLLHVFDRHGAAYDQAVASYALKLYPPLPGTYRGEPLADAMKRYPATARAWHLSPGARLVKGPQGVHVLVGQEEAEWLRHWEDRILQAVRLKIKAPLEGEAVGVGQVQEVREVGRGL